MRNSRILLLCAALAAAGCATPAPPAGLAMPAPDEARAASLLAGYLLATGWTVRLADEALVAASRGDEVIRLEPVLDAEGLDRVIVSRSWRRAEDATDDALQAFALELNEALNVGQFRAADEGLVLQASLPFLENLAPLLLDAFLVYMAEVRFAVLQVQGERRLLAPVEGAAASR